MVQTSQKDDTVGVFSSDLSTQIFMMDTQEGTDKVFLSDGEVLPRDIPESFRTGWRKKN